MVEFWLWGEEGEEWRNLGIGFVYNAPRVYLFIYFFFDILIGGIF